MAQSTLWEVITYDVLDGQVNDMHNTGRVVEIDDDEDDNNVIEALRGAGEVSPNTMIELDGDEDIIYVNDKETGWPFGELRRTDKPSTGRLQ